MSEILGYTKDGKPIHPSKPGMVSTACTINCSVCGNGIRGMGGPKHGAKCVPCYTGYPVYEKDSQQAADFRTAFAKARNEGLKVFTWEGRLYNTKLEGE